MSLNLYGLSGPVYIWALLSGPVYIGALVSGSPGPVYKASLKFVSQDGPQIEVKVVAIQTKFNWRTANNPFSFFANTPFTLIHFIFAILDSSDDEDEILELNVSNHIQDTPRPGKPFFIYIS